MRFRIIPNISGTWYIQEPGLFWGWKTITAVDTFEEGVAWLDRFEALWKHQQKPYERFINL